MFWFNLLICAWLRFLPPLTSQAALELLNAVAANDVNVLESLCLMGMIPVVIKFAGTNNKNAVRRQARRPVVCPCFLIDNDCIAIAVQSKVFNLGATHVGGSFSFAQAALFLHQLCFAASQTMQMLIACQGLSVLVSLVEVDYKVRAQCQLACLRMH
jgi:hypothetical protein